MKEQIIKVITPNKMLFIKGKLSRTPLEVIINNENELNLLKSSMEHQDVEFTVETYIKPKPVKKTKTKNSLTKKKVTKKEDEKSKSILEKISNDENTE